MLAGRGHAGALVDIFLAGGAGVAGGAGAHRLAGHLVRVAPRALVARVPGALVLQVAEQAGLARRALALVAPHLVVARAAVLTRTVHALVAVLFAVAALVAVDADALVAALGVLAGAVVLAGLRDGALVQVDSAVLAGPGGGAAAGVGGDSVLAEAAVLAEVAGAIVEVLLAVTTGETWGGGGAGDGRLGLGQLSTEWVGRTL